MVEAALGGEEKSLFQKASPPPPKPHLPLLFKDFRVYRILFVVFPGAILGGRALESSFALLKAAKDTPLRCPCDLRAAIASSASPRFPFLPEHLRELLMDFN